MDKPSPTVQALAEHLLAIEAKSKGAPEVHEAVRVITKLHVSLMRFAGADGSASLLRRALALATAEVPALRVVKLNSDGYLEGFEDVVSHANTDTSDVAIAITAYLLALLETFVGYPLTLGLVREAWPDERIEE